MINDGGNLEIGNYIICKTARGGYKISTPGKKAKFLPPDKELIERYHRENGEGKISDGLQAQIGFRGIVYCGIRSVPKGREVLGLPFPTTTTKTGKKIQLRYISLEEAMRSVYNFWPAEKTNDDKKENLKPIKEFKEKHKRVYDAIHRRHLFGGFEKFLDTCFYKGFYSRLKKADNVIYKDQIDLDKLTTTIILRHSQGLPISKNALKALGKDERKIVRAVENLNERKLFGRPLGYTKTVMKLTGLKKGDIEMPKGGAGFVGGIGEDLTEFLIRWAILTGTDLPKHIERGPIYRSGNAETKFFHNNKSCLADLRVNNQPIEVKSGLGLFQKGNIEDIINKYGRDQNKWETGEPLENSVVIFHMAKNLYKDRLKQITYEGINVVGYDEFHSKLKDLIKIMRSHYLEELQTIKPRINDLNYILKLHEEIALNSSSILRSGNIFRKKWSKKIMTSLINKAKKLEHAN